MTKEEYKKLEELYKEKGWLTLSLIHRRLRVPMSRAYSLYSDAALFWGMEIIPEGREFGMFSRGQDFGKSEKEE